VAKSAETSRDDDDDDDDDEDDVKLQSSGVDPDRLKAFNVSLWRNYTVSQKTSTFLFFQ